MTPTQRISALCAEQGRTVAWLRAAVGMSTHRWNNVACGHSAWHIAEARAICRRLRVKQAAIWPAGWLFVEGVTKGGQPRRRLARRQQQQRQQPRPQEHTEQQTGQGRGAA